jgi:hypothetical protein
LEARGRVAWVGELHSEMLRDFMKNKKAWLGKKPSLETRCNVLWRLTHKSIAKSSEHVPVTKEMIAAAKSEGTKRGCSAPTDLESLVTASAPVAAQSRQLSLFGTIVTQEEPSGAYQDYTPALEAAWNGATTPSAVESASWAVVDQAAAANIPQADLDIVAAAASVSVSSAYDWYAYGQSGGFEGGGGGGGGEDPMSLFQGWLEKFGTVGKCDLLGALVGAILGGIGGAFIGGFVASAACLAFL